MTWTNEHLTGLLPEIITSRDPRSVKEQITDKYAHGGGYRAVNGFTLGTDGTLRYEGDPPFKEVARTQVREELVILFDYSFVAIVQPNSTFEVVRMD